MKIIKKYKLIIISLSFFFNHSFAAYDFETTADYMRTADSINQSYLKKLMAGSSYHNIHDFKEGVLGTNKNLSLWDVFSTKIYKELVVMKKNRDPYTGQRSFQCINGNTLSGCDKVPSIGNY